MPGQSLETAVPGPGLSRSLAVPQLTCHNYQLCDNLVIIIDGEKQKILELPNEKVLPALTRFLKPV